MSLETLRKATKSYLDRERALNDSAEILDRPELREQLAAAAQELQAELRSAGQAVGREGAIRRIMVAVDAAEPSEWAVERAVCLAEDLGARITLVHVLDLTPIGFPELAPYVAETIETQEDDAWQLLHRMSSLVPHEILAEEILREGSVAKQIILAAEQFKPDLLVVGTHGRGPVGRLLLGSIAEAVLRHAPCPLLIVAHPFRKAKGGSRVELRDEAVSAPTT